MGCGQYVEAFQCQKIEFNLIGNEEVLFFSQKNSTEKDVLVIHFNELGEEKA